MSKRERVTQAKKLWAVSCFSERRGDPRMPQRTPGFKIFRNFLYSPNKTRMAKGDAEIQNRLTRELAGSVAQQTGDLGSNKQQLVQFPSSRRCLSLREGAMCPESIKHNLLPPGVEIPPPPHGAERVFQKPVTFQEEIIVLVRCWPCPVLSSVPNRKEANKTR